MAIYRGVGGAGEANDDATLNAVTEKATDAATSASQAASSASAAASSASSASTSATNAATSASSASTSASTATTQATNAATSATASAASASAANTSAGTASDEANYAEEWATKAEDSLISTAAGGDGSTDYSSLHHAAKSADSATASASSATSAASSATTATTKASEAATSATAAASSATAAASSASSASTSATNAATSATSAASSATSASSAQTAAESARDATLAAYDSFDDRYLGAKASDPTVDNDGNALVAGTLYFNTTDESMKLYTGSAWVDSYASGSSFLALSGGTMTGDINFGDNDKAIFGAGSDLQIYHDPTAGHSQIREGGTGNLYIAGTNLILEDTAQADYLTAVSGGAVTIHHAGSPKLATTSTGIDVTGTVTADGFKPEYYTGSYNVDGTISNYSSSNAVYLNGNASGWLQLSGDGTRSTRIKVNGSTVASEADSIGLYTSSAHRMRIASNGDISFYEDTGTTAKFFWDASAESLGIGTTSTGTYALAVDSQGKGVSNAEAGIYSKATRSGVTWNLVSNNTYTGTNTGTGIKFTSGDFDTGAIIVRADGTASSGDAAGYMTFHTSNNASEDLAERMRIDSSGNVGIGTSSPDEKLNVAGNIRAEASSVPKLQLKRTGATAGNGYIECLGSDDSVDYKIAFAQSANVMSFDVAGSTVMSINNNNELKFNSGYGSVATAYGCRAWVNFNGTGTVAIRASGNVSSITDRGTGKHRVNFATSMPDANYSAVVSGVKDNTTDDANFQFTLGASNTTYSTSAVDITGRRATDGLVDSPKICVSVFR